MALAPYDAESLATLAYMIATSGDWQRGVALATKANALDAAAGSCDAIPQLLLDGRLRTRSRTDQADPRSTSACDQEHRLPPDPGPARPQEEAREKWQKVLAEDPSWSAKLVKWYKLWNIRDEDTAKLMEGIYKTGVLGPEERKPRPVT